MPVVRKQVLAPGRYWINGSFTDFSPADVRTFYENGKGMVRDRLPIRVPKEHQEYADPLDDAKRKALDVELNKGFVKDFHLDNDQSLWVDLDVPDEEFAKRLNTEIKYVSPRILPGGFTDGTGKRWGPCVAHVALTCKPVWHGQKPFGAEMLSKLQAAATDGAKLMSLSDMPADMGPLDFSLENRVVQVNGIWAPVEMATRIKEKDWEEFLKQNPHVAAAMGGKHGGRTAKQAPATPPKKSAAPVAKPAVVRPPPAPRGEPSVAQLREHYAHARSHHEAEAERHGLATDPNAKQRVKHHQGKAQHYANKLTELIRGVTAPSAAPSAERVTHEEEVGEPRAPAKNAPVSERRAYHEKAHRYHSEHQKKESASYKDAKSRGQHSFTEFHGKMAKGHGFQATHHRRELEKLGGQVASPSTARVAESKPTPAAVPTPAPTATPSQPAAMPGVAEHPAVKYRSHFKQQHLPASGYSAAATVAYHPGGKSVPAHEQATFHRQMAEHHRGQHEATGTPGRAEGGSGTPHELAAEHHEHEAAKHERTMGTSVAPASKPAPTAQPQPTLPSSGTKVHLRSPGSKKITVQSQAVKFKGAPIAVHSLLSHPEGKGAAPKHHEAFHRVLADYHSKRANEYKSAGNNEHAIAHHLAATHHHTAAEKHEVRNRVMGSGNELKPATAAQHVQFHQIMGRMHRKNISQASVVHPSRVAFHKEQANFHESQVAGARSLHNTPIGAKVVQYHGAGKEMSLDLSLDALDFALDCEVGGVTDEKPFTVTIDMSVPLESVVGSTPLTGVVKQTADTTIPFGDEEWGGDDPQKSEEEKQKRAQAANKTTGTAYGANGLADVTVGLSMDMAEQVPFLHHYDPRVQEYQYHVGHAIHHHVTSTSRDMPSMMQSESGEAKKYHLQRAGEIYNRIPKNMRNQFHQHVAEHFEKSAADPGWTSPRHAALHASVAKQHRQGAETELSLDFSEDNGSRVYGDGGTSSGNDGHSPYIKIDDQLSLRRTADVIKEVPQFASPNPEAKPMEREPIHDGFSLLVSGDTNHDMPQADVDTPDYNRRKAEWHESMAKEAEERGDHELAGGHHHFAAIHGRKAEQPAPAMPLGPQYMSLDMAFDPEESSQHIEKMHDVKLAPGGSALGQRAGQYPAVSEHVKTQFEAPGHYSPEEAQAYHHNLAGHHGMSAQHFDKMLGGEFMAGEHRKAMGFHGKMAGRKNPLTGALPKSFSLDMAAGINYPTGTATPAEPYPGYNPNHSAPGIDYPATGKQAQDEPVEPINYGAFEPIQYVPTADQTAQWGSEPHISVPSLLEHPNMGATPFQAWGFHDQMEKHHSGEASKSTGRTRAAHEAAASYHKMGAYDAGLPPQYMSLDFAAKVEDDKKPKKKEKDGKEGKKSDPNENKDAPTGAQDSKAGDGSAPQSMTEMEKDAELHDNARRHFASAKDLLKERGVPLPDHVDHMTGWEHLNTALMNQKDAIGNILDNGSEENKSQQQAQRQAKEEPLTVSMSNNGTQEAIEMSTVQRPGQALDLSANPQFIELSRQNAETRKQNEYWRKKAASQTLKEYTDKLAGHIKRGSCSNVIADSIHKALAAKEMSLADDNHGDIEVHRALAKLEVLDQLPDGAFVNMSTVTATEEENKAVTPAVPPWHMSMAPGSETEQLKVATEMAAMANRGRQPSTNGTR